MADTPDTPPDPAEDDLQTLRLRVPRHLKERVIAYAVAHPRQGAYGATQPLSQNTAAILILETGLSVSEQETLPLDS